MSSPNCQLYIRRISDIRETGSIYIVDSVGVGDNGAPFIVVDMTKYDIPLSLIMWVNTTLAMPEIKFPCRIEFSIIHGKAAADFVLE